MATKSQHSPAYRPLMALLRALREEAELTQRDLGELLGKPQSWIHNCEVGNRRVDVAEFAAWATACGVEPPAAFQRFLRSSNSQAKSSRKAPRR
jgi:transcriptional regulator with XRE-family HTH domain